MPIQCLSIYDIWVYVEHLLPRIEHICLSADSIMRVISRHHLPFGWQGEVISICLIVVAKEVVWWSRLKGLKIDTFLCGHQLFQISSEKESEG